MAVKDWWKRYPEKSTGYSRDAKSFEFPDPRLTVGARVRLCGKPDKVRRVERVEWHSYRQRYVYEVEVSGAAYWFSDQLMLEGSDLPIVELPGSSRGAASEIWAYLVKLFINSREYLK